MAARSNTDVVRGSSARNAGLTTSAKATVVHRSLRRRWKACTTATLVVLGGVVFTTPQSPSTLTGPKASDVQLATIKQYCAGCHNDRIKAAGQAVAYERYKLSMQLRVGPSVLGERLAQARAIKAVEPKVIEHDPAA